MTRYRVMVAKRVPTHRFLKPIVGSNGKSPVVEAKSKQDARAKVRKRCGHKFVVGKAYPVSSQLEGLTVKRFRLPPWLDLIIMPLAFAVIVGALILTLVAVAGCATKTTGGTAYASEVKRSIVERVDGTKEDTTSVVESGMTLPENAEDGGSASTDSAGAAVDGGSQVSDGSAETRAYTLTIFGVLCILGGVAVFYLRSLSIPFVKRYVSWHAGVLLIGCGVALLSWHFLAGPIAVIMISALGLFVVFAIIYLAGGFNKFKEERDELAKKPKAPE